MKLKTIVLFLFFLGQITIAQNDSIKGIYLIDHYLSKKNISKADSTLKAQINSFKRKSQFDSLPPYTYYIGKVQLAKGFSNSQAEAQVKEFVSDLKNNTKDARTIFKAYLKLYDFYIDIGDDNNCLQASLKALEYANTVTNITPDELGEINYIIGGNYYALYNLNDAAVYFKASAKAYEQSSKIEKHILADSYNGVAVSMWTLNKLDSARVYFDKAIKATKESTLESFKRTFYMTAFKFNLALVIDDQGKASEAITLTEDIITDLENIINNSNDEELIEKAKGLQASSISNLAAFYHDIGHLNKAYDMLQYAYRKKIEVFENTNPRIATTLNQLALSEIELQEFDKSIETSNKALEVLKNASSDYLSVKASVLHLKAKSYAHKKDLKRALELFKESYSIYKKAYPKEYSREFLNMLRDYTSLLAKGNDYKKAISLATNAYNYVRKNSGSNNLLLLKEIENLSEIHFENDNYTESLSWIYNGYDFLNEQLKNASSSLDSVQIEFKRPLLILRECKSLHALTNQKEASFLIELTTKLDNALGVLEKRKTTIINSKDINILLSEYNLITEFSKQIHLELYNITRQKKYLSKLINLNESSIYYRIRMRLNSKHNITFSKIPKNIIKRENELKNKLSTTIANSENIQSYFETNKNWLQFIDSLKTNYPTYYKMRYATLNESIENLESLIEETSTLVRYLHINNSLFAIVISNSSSRLFPLEKTGIAKDIASLQNENALFNRQIDTTLHKLYLKLWKPIENAITTKKVIVIPDKALFNLSFEMLIEKPKSKSYLLNKHSFSYNYSLFLTAKESETIGYDNNFIAFAPEFTDDMKLNYKIALQDSLNYDKTYLTLLPQPFAKDLANSTSRMFNGTSFLNENSTEQVFINNAKEHKIIHIGTHAESNNVTPELSRLIFAKQIKNDSIRNDNSLYTYEIYNCNLASNLTVLTACDTGKPTYQSGEGMISLAHAFNYAGSESILTSLWKVDEQSSSQIVSYFYEFLSNGETKDDALRKAKLSYLKNAEGRTKAPQYWAGLVLIGDTSPIDINIQDSNYLFWILGVALLSFAITIILILKRRSYQFNDSFSSN